jgi:hypothetical protein
VSYTDRASLQRRVSELELEIVRLNNHKQSMADHIIWMLEASETMIAACKVLMKGVDLGESPTPPQEKEDD